MRSIRGGLLLAVGIIAAMVIPAIASAAYPGANGLIAYSGGAPGPREIFNVSSVGGDPNRLTTNSVSDASPSWSADGRRIAFQRRCVRELCLWKVWTMRADGANQRQITTGPGEYSAPHFSPGGGRIVMTHFSYRRGICHIIVMRTNGTDRRRLPGCGAPEFSPDGKRIAFAGAPSYLSSSDRGIWVMNRDGSHLRRLVKADDDGASEVYQPDFSPDGSHIVYSRCMPESPPHDCGYQAVVMRSGGGFKHVISRDQQPQRPIFSPDGTRIAMSRGIPCSSEAYGGRIVTIAFNGTHPQVVTQPDVEECHEESSDLEPNWQPIPPSW